MNEHHLKVGFGPSAATYEPLLSEDQAIEALGLFDRPNPSGALRWLIRTKKLGCVRLGRILRFKPTDIHQFVDRHHQAPE